MPKSIQSDQIVAPLSREFYLADAVTVARALLGKRLVHQSREGTTAGIIVETEAYAGHDDTACHSYLRKAPVAKHRTNIMFNEGGFVYVYLIYGMYNCFNVVVNEAGNPEAVLIRALEPVEGLPLMAKRRGLDISSITRLKQGATQESRVQNQSTPRKQVSLVALAHASCSDDSNGNEANAYAKKLCSGPGKLCIAMGITREHYGLDLCQPASIGDITITEGKIITESDITTTPRINVDYAGEASGWLYRFVLRKTPFLSTRKFM
jgi:DNA-3-methyladenine glycosylase